MYKSCFLSVFLILFLLSACSRHSEEEILSRYPSGKKLETGIFIGDSTKRTRLKSFEYYETGERKKEFAHQDNHFLGPWTFWYKNGKVLAKGNITVKTMTHETAIGSGTYYWPGGGTMIEITPSADGQSTMVSKIHDEQGKSYLSDAAPELSHRIKQLLDQWQDGTI